MRASPVKSQGDLPERREASPLGHPEIQESVRSREEFAGLQEVAAALVDKPLADLLAIGRRADGSLVVVVSPGPKYVFTPEQVEDARRGRAAAIAARRPHRAKAKPPKAAGPDPERAAQPNPAIGLRGAVGAGSRGAHVAGEPPKE